MKLDNELSEREVKMFSPLQLAYIGDAVYEVYVRKYLLLNTKVKVNGLHKEAIKYVKAKAQANAVRVIKETLTEEEWRVVKRGRNAKSSTVPKNANINDYKYATGFEALIGYLHLTNKDVRIKELFDIIIKDN